MSTSLLFIEDDKVQQITWKKIFEQLGNFNVTIANDGYEGLEKLSKSISIIVLDISMPKMNGTKFLENLYTNEKYEKFRKIPIVVLTVWSDDEEIKKDCIKYENVTLMSKEEDDREGLIKVILEKIK